MTDRVTILSILLILAGCDCGDGESVGRDAGRADAGTDASAEDPCLEATTLPAEIDEDTTVGPGCFILDQTRVGSDAVLTIAAGTTLLVEPAGWLGMSRSLTAPGDGGRLIAVGTESEPILFTPNSDAPAPGDWGCVFFGSDAAGSEMEHVVVEYGGSACGASGGAPDSQIVIESPIDTLRSVTSRHSAGHGLELNQDGDVRTFENNRFADNAQASLTIGGDHIVVPTSSTVFDDADDHIEVYSAAMNRGGTVSSQTVPYRFLEGAVVGPVEAPEIVVEGGVRFELESANFEIRGGNMVVEGTADDPVVFTSSKAAPAADDWGCVWFRHGDIGTRATGTVTVAHAVIEYAGGTGCGNLNDFQSALVVDTAADLTSLTFRSIDGHAIIVPLADCPANACDHTFTDVSAEPLSCNGTPQTCP